MYHQQSSRSRSRSTSHGSSSSDRLPPRFQVLPLPPLYRIDLSAPPAQRWTQPIADFREELQQASHLYQSILDQTGWPKLVGGLASAFLRRVYNKEEQEEVRGIAQDSGLRRCEVVAYNTFLDLFSGCASGGVRARVPPSLPSRFSEEQGAGSSRRLGRSKGTKSSNLTARVGTTRSTMVHFRNLDWGMPVLRDLLIRVEYVREGRVVARAVTYVGYVGVLTGVREGLSMSLNFRLRIPTHPASLKEALSSAKHYAHYLLVLLGIRPSTSSHLRSLLLSPGPPPSLDEVIEYTKTKKSGPCYLTFCSAQEVVIIEKGLDGVLDGVARPTMEAVEHQEGAETMDKRRHGMQLRPRKNQRKGVGEGNSPPSPRSDGGTQRDHSFAVVTNHDRSVEGLSKREWSAEWRDSTAAESGVGGFDWILGDSMERKNCVRGMWEGSKGCGSALRTRSRSGVEEGEEDSVDFEHVKRWLRTYPVRNECTHFSCIMDPGREGGGMLWVEACQATRSTATERAILNVVESVAKRLPEQAKRPHLEPVPDARPKIHPNEEVIDLLNSIAVTPYTSSFVSRLQGSQETESPIAVDWDTVSPWMRLMSDIRQHYLLSTGSSGGFAATMETIAPIVYTTLQKSHLSQVHDLLERIFWTGIDVSDSLDYQPERATVVAMYKKLVIGIAIMSSPQETYITYLGVKAGWDKTQIAKNMLYHLISRNPFKDITLHVSANNSAILLYNQFGFKAEEFVVGFYEDYLDPNSRASKNAFKLRLRQ